MQTGHTEITVRGYHLDLYQHVNNARYLEFLEEARWALFEQSLRTEFIQKEGLAFVVVNVNISYRKPATLGDRLIIQTTLGKVGQKSITLVQKVFKKGQEDTPITEALVTFVLVSGKTGKSVPVTPELLQNMGIEIN
jgi:thioesterase-3